MAAVPAPAGQIDAARRTPVAGVRGGGAFVLAARVLCGRLLRRFVRLRHIHPQPSDRVPLPSGGPRDRDSQRRRPYTPHRRLRRVSPLRSPPPRVQVLVCYFATFLYLVFFLLGFY